ncbi:hypothetical protein E2C01_097027 [Portunus trituberculatus]|uniref:Uncharacterized protein n=1 Tax=Portunus trituberculatus TaxID=210409 RepID=A0A5B7KA16_PORTR|nr:hypothetical protein [Portunus trituberculatus]
MRGDWSFFRARKNSQEEDKLTGGFTVLRQEKPMVQGQGAPGLEERRQQAQASRRNQRLAAQMERRPAVVAALKLKKVLVSKYCLYTE